MRDEPLAAAEATDNPAQAEVEDAPVRGPGSAATGALPKAPERRRGFGVEPLKPALDRARRSCDGVAPGPTATDMFLKGKDEETLSRLANAVPLERFGTPADIASVVAFLASPAGHWNNRRSASTAASSAKEDTDTHPNPATRSRRNRHWLWGA